MAGMVWYMHSISTFSLTPAIAHKYEKLLRLAIDSQTETGLFRDKTVLVENNIN